MRVESNVKEQHLVTCKVSPHHALRETELLTVVSFQQISLSSCLSLTEEVAVSQA